MTKKRIPKLGKIKSTSRGFALVEWQDAYGEPCSLQHSSLLEPHIWLGCDQNAKPHHVTGEVQSPRMHLNKRQVESLVRHLQLWLRYGHF